VLVERRQAPRDAPDNIEKVIFLKLALAECFPRLIILLVSLLFIFGTIGDGIDRGLSFDKNKLVLNVPPIINFDQVFILDFAESLNQIDGLPSLLLVQGCDIDTDDHEGPGLLS
jgi:hypothetical protein